MSKFRSGNAAGGKLTPGQVAEIRELWESNTYNQRQLCIMFNVTIGTIGRIVRGETHRKVEIRERVPTPMTDEELSAAAKRSEAEFIRMMGLKPPEGMSTAPSEGLARLEKELAKLNKADDLIEECRNTTTGDDDDKAKKG